MDILIKGMEMPKDCRYCPCVRFNKEYGIVRCHAVYDNCNEEDVVARDFDEVDMFDTTQSKPLVKPSWCPLVALPPHGDLKDADEIISKMERVICTNGLAHTIAFGLSKKIIEEAPVIVEATE